MVMEQNDAWAVAWRYLSPETGERVCDDNPVDALKLAALT